MNFNLSQSLQLQQKMAFSMIQSLEIMQMNTLQLEQRLRAELEINPILEIDEDMEVETDERLDDNETRERDEDEYLEELNSGEDNIDWEEYLEEGFDLGYSHSEEFDSNAERYEAAPVYEKTLEEHLMEQLSGKKFGERGKRLIDFLIGSLDDDGYLRVPMSEITELTQTTVYEAEKALSILRGLDPAGVGARDLRECMMLQLSARGMCESLAMTIVDKCWDLLEKLKIPTISRSLGISAHEIQDAIDIIKTLTPKPGYQYGAGSSAAITPDLIVEKVDGRFIVMFNDRSIPSLHINEHYASLTKRGSKARKEDKKYIRDNLNRANLFIKAIEQRRSTMLKVMNAIIKCQITFFEEGPPNLEPLIMEDVARMIDMSISTVSRVANSKYVQTPHGIFELKYFFTETAGRQVTKKSTRRDVSGEDGGPAENAQRGGAAEPDVSVERIRNRVRQLIDDEDPGNPLTDQTIADILKTENFPAARRTVAKYRENMKILPARMRLKYD